MVGLVMFSSQALQYFRKRSFKAGWGGGFLFWGGGLFVLGFLGFVCLFVCFLSSKSLSSKTRLSFPWRQVIRSSKLITVLCLSRLCWSLGP